jgi:hypothetical protein
MRSDRSGDSASEDGPKYCSVRQFRSRKPRLVDARLANDPGRLGRSIMSVTMSDNPEEKWIELYTSAMLELKHALKRMGRHY